MSVDVTGAQGGDIPGGGPPGGKGGRVQAVIAVTPGETLSIKVGGKGGPGTWAAGFSGGAGGYGGGSGGAGGENGAFNSGGGGGGGASRVTGSSALVVAGGGGGSSTGLHGGSAGGTGGSAYTVGSSGASGNAGVGGVGGGSGAGGGGGTASGGGGAGGAGGANGGGSGASGSSTGTGGAAGAGQATNGGAGGGGGGGGYGGGGGGGGAGYTITSGSGGGGGGGGGSSYGPTGSVFSVGVGDSQTPGDGLVILTWGDTNVWGTELVFTTPAATGAVGGTATLTFVAKNHDGSNFSGTVYYGYGPLGSVFWDRTVSVTNGAGSIQVPITSGTQQVTAFANSSTQGWTDNHDYTELPGVAYVVGQPSCGTPTAVTLTPSADAKTTGQTATLTAKVLDNCGNPKSGVTVNFSRGGPNSGSSNALTNASGEATHSWTGSAQGVDTIDATVSGATVQGKATVVWTTPPPVVFGTELVFNPPVVNGTVGQTATLNFVAKNHDGSNFSGNVRYGVGPAGTPPAFSQTTPVTNGVGSIPVPITSNPQEVVAHADSPSAGTVGAQDSTELVGTAAVVGQPACANPAIVTLSPAADAKTTGQSATVTAKVLDNCGNPRSGVTVNFSRSGPNPGSGSGVTGADGTTTHTWTGANAGTDTIDAAVTGASVSGKAAVVWSGSVSAQALTLSPPAQTQTTGATAALTAHVVNQSGAPVSGATVRFSRSGANGAASQDVLTNASGDASYSYVGANAGVDTVQAQVLGSATAVGEATVEWVPPAGGATYPSDDCTGTAVFDGFAGPDYLKLRTGSGGGANWVCVALDSGGTHVGGKLSVGGSAGTPSVDDNQGACDLNPASRVRDQEGFLGTLTYDLDVNLSPAPGEAAWVCLSVVETFTGTTVVAKRIVVAASSPSGTGFVPDATAAHPATGSYIPAVNPGAVSSYCQANGGTRLINVTVGTARVWAYTLAQNGNTKQTLCLRAQNGSTVGGVRLTVDGGGSQTLVTASQQDVSPSVFATYCSIPVFGNADPYVFVKAGATGTTAYGCLGLLSFNKLITLGANPGGGQTVISHAAETS